ncbi:MAG: hypothetical protein MK213_02985, partial [Planctomycetes bacterium]|nr:hypothetical protein [Planctomycetota bacterium]
EVARTFAYRALERGLVEEARGYLQEACEIDPTDLDSFAALARLHLTEGDSRASIAYAEHAATSIPSNFDHQLVYAAALAENNRAEKASTVLASAWEAGDQGTQTARALLTHYTAAGDQSTAKTFVKTLLAERPEEASIWAVAGDLYLAEGQLEAATSAYQEALDRDPEIATPVVLKWRLGLEHRDLDPVLAAATTAERKGDFGAAERLYRYLSTTEHQSQQVTCGLARVLWKHGAYSQARTTLHAINVEDRTWQDHLLQAKLDMRQAHWSSAKGALLLALQLRPGLRAAELLLAHTNQQLAGIR